MQYIFILFYLVLLVCSLRRFRYEGEKYQMAVLRRIRLKWNSFQWARNNYLRSLKWKAVQIENKNVIIISLTCVHSNVLSVNKKFIGNIYFLNFFWCWWRNFIFRFKNERLFIYTLSVISSSTNIVDCSQKKYFLNVWFLI